MSAYLIANKDSQELETIVFAGEGGKEVAAVFTDPNKASKYIEEAGWQDQYTTATLDSIAFMEWLLKCHRIGIELLATDPTRADHESGQRINTLNIEAHLKHAGEHIVLVANPDF